VGGREKRRKEERRSEGCKEGKKKGREDPGLSVWAQYITKGFVRERQKGDYPWRRWDCGIRGREIKMLNCQPCRWRRGQETGNLNSLYKPA
jgi:hypothetical protein